MFQFSIMCTFSLSPSPLIITCYIDLRPTRLSPFET
jgi:hypothetical protein